MPDVQHVYTLLSVNVNVFNDSCNLDITHCLTSQRPNWTARLLAPSDNISRPICFHCHS